MKSKKQNAKEIKAAMLAAEKADAKDLHSKALIAAYQHGWDDCAVEAEALRLKTAQETEALRKKAKEAARGWFEKLFD